MKKYLKEIETAAMILLLIGLIIALTAGYNYGAWPCGIGLLMLMLTFLYKAFKWKEYAKENKRNIVIILVAILFLLIQMLMIR